MQFSNKFEVSLPPSQSWPLLIDVEAIVPCMPGAEIVEMIDDKNFRAKISTRLGPVAMTFACDLSFIEINQESMTAKVKGKGADVKGRGTAEATVTFRCMPSALGTLVVIETDLALSGAVAQYGRGAGLLQTVAGQIISQFSRNLELRIAQLKEHGISLDRQAEKTHSGAKVTLDTPAQDFQSSAGSSQMSMPTATKDFAVGATSSNYQQAFQEGFSSGFSAGHASGFAMARNLMGGISKSACYERLTPGGSTEIKRENSLPPFKSQPIGGFSLMISSIWTSLRGLFSKQHN